MKSNVKVADFVNVPFNSPTLIFFIKFNSIDIGFKFCRINLDIISYLFEFLKTEILILSPWNRMSK